MYTKDEFRLPEVWIYKRSVPSVCRSSSCIARRRRLKTEKEDNNIFKKYLFEGFLIFFRTILVQ
jgi:hypothetical protein